MEPFIVSGTISGERGGSCAESMPVKFVILPAFARA